MQEYLAAFGSFVLAVKKTKSLLLWIIFVFVSLSGCATPAQLVVDEPLHLVGQPDLTAPQAMQISPAIQEEASRQGALWYQIEIGDAQLQVRTRLLSPPSRTTFFLPGQWAGESNFSRGIAIISASGPDGSLPFTVDRITNRIDVQTGESDWVELHYAINLERPAIGSSRYFPQIRNGIVFAYAPTFLILPSEQVSRLLSDILVEIRAPSMHQVFTTWPSSHVSPSKVDPEHAVHGFVIENVARLRDAFIFSGPLLIVHRTELNGQRINVAFEPEFKLPLRQSIVRELTQLVQRYNATYGAHDQITVVVRQSPPREPLGGMGRRNGFVLEIPASVEFDDQLRILIAHEAFHMWNGHRLVPRAQAEAGTRWFKEGVTHYIALQTLCQLNLITEDVVRQEFALAAQNYLDNPLVSGSSSNSLDQARLPYDFGLLLALALDLELRRAKPGHSLAQWIQAMLARVTTQGTLYYNEEFLRRSLMKPFADASSITALWEAHVQQNVPIPVAELFNGIGWHWLEASIDRTARILPLEGLSERSNELFCR